MAVIRSGTLAPLPLQTRQPAFGVGLNRYVSVGQYLAGSPVPDRTVWESAMTTDGFVVAEAIGYQAGSDVYGAEALDFASPAGAADFQQQTLAALCRTQTAHDMQPTTGLSDAATFVGTDGFAPYRASLVIGSSVIHLNLCRCVETPDKVATVSNWARAVGQQLATKP